MTFRMTTAAAATFALSLATLTLVGCGPAAGRPTGRVLDEGEPVAGAELLFESQSDGKTVAIGGMTGSDGVYALDYSVYSGIPVGPAKVTVKRTVTRDGDPLPEGEEGASLVRAGQTKTQVVEFEREIAPGPASVDFELTEGQGGSP